MPLALWTREALRSTNLAPGVSGALLTTVAALLVAIPTVFIYNSLLSSTRSEITRLENFASLVADRIELDSARLSSFLMPLQTPNSPKHFRNRKARNLKADHGPRFQTVERSSTAISDLNITPLIDLAFALLIIFMITTPVIEQYNRIDLPDQSTSDQQPKKQPEDKTITIDANGAYQWGGDDVTKERLEALLDEIAEAPTSRPARSAYSRGQESSYIKRSSMSWICLKLAI